MCYAASYTGTKNAQSRRSWVLVRLIEFNGQIRRGDPLVIPFNYPSLWNCR